MNFYPFMTSHRSSLLFGNAFSANPIEFDRLENGIDAKRGSEVAAASALAALHSGNSAPLPSAYQQHMYRRLQQKEKMQGDIMRRQIQRHDGRMEDKNEFEVPQRYTKNGRKRAVPFPIKLMKVLTNDRYSHIISWMPSGRSFVILRPKAFVADILPHHFKSAQYASFTRKLARWGFSRCDDGTGEFFHPQFRKDRLDLAEKMKCLGHSPKSVQAKKMGQKQQQPQVTSINRVKDDTKAAAEETSDDDDTASSDDGSAQSSANTSNSRGRCQQITPASAVAAGRRASDLPSFSFTPRDVVGDQDHLMDIEFEMLRLRRCIHKAAMSREALAGLHEQAWGGRLGDSTRAFALAQSGLSELPGRTNRHALAGAAAPYPPQNMNMRSMMGNMRLPRDVHLASMSSRAQRPNMQGAKSARRMISFCVPDGIPCDAYYR